MQPSLSHARSPPFALNVCCELLPSDFQPYQNRSHNEEFTPTDSDGCPATSCLGVSGRDRRTQRAPEVVSRSVSIAPQQEEVQAVARALAEALAEPKLRERLLRVRA